MKVFSYTKKKTKLKHTRMEKTPKQMITKIMIIMMNLAMSAVRIFELFIIFIIITVNTCKWTQSKGSHKHM